MAEATKLTLEKQQVLEELEEKTHIRGKKCLLCYKYARVPDHICTGSLCRIESNRGTTDQYIEDGGVAKDNYNPYYEICPAHMPKWLENKEYNARMTAIRLENQEREKERLIERRAACERGRRYKDKIHMDRCLDCIMLELMGPSSKN